MTTPIKDIDTQIESLFYSDEAVSKKRNILMDLIGAILDAPRKESSAELWKLHIDASLDRLDNELYQPAIKTLLIQQKGGYAKSDVASIAQIPQVDNLHELLVWAIYMRQSNEAYKRQTIWGKKQKREAQIYANVFAMVEKRIRREMDNRTRVTDLATTDHKPSNSPANPQSKASLKRELT